MGIFIKYRIHRSLLIYASLNAFLVLFFFSEVESQGATSLTHTLNECDLVISGTILRLDTFTDFSTYHRDDYFSFNKVKAGIAHMSVKSIKYGNMDDNTIEIYYLRESNSHMKKANLDVNKEYIAFLAFDSVQNYYTLPYQRKSIFLLTPRLDSVYSLIINNFTHTAGFNYCQYFEFLSLGINDDIPLIKWELDGIAFSYDSLKERFCIDSMEALNYLTAFRTTLFVPYIDFTIGLYNDEIDKILLENINLEIKRIEASDDMYDLLEKIHITDYLPKLSFASSNPSFKETLEKLKDLLYVGNDKEFIALTQKLLNE